MLHNMFLIKILRWIEACESETEVNDWSALRAASPGWITIYSTEAISAVLIVSQATSGSLAQNPCLNHGSQQGIKVSFQEEVKLSQNMMDIHKLFIFNCA